MVEAGISGRSSAAGRDIVAWLTVEKAAYLGAVLLALLLRLLLLGVAPLGPAEAVQALPALAASTGQQYALVGTSSLLFGLQRLLFTLFGASGAWARWWPAMLGGLAPLLYYALRRPLGRGGALVAAYLWAVSPMTVFTTRLGLGLALVPTLSLAMIAGLAWSVREDASGGRVHGLLLAAAALGLLLSADSSSYTVLLVTFVALLIWRHSYAGFFDALKASWKQAGGVLLLSFALGSTFFLMAPRGLAAAADLLGAWLANLAPGTGEYRVWEIAVRLVLSEPVLLGFGVAGLVAAVRRRDRFGLFAGAFAGVVLFLSLFGNGRQPTDLGLVALAFTFLAGPVIARVLSGAWALRREVDAWLLVVVTTILLLTAALCLTGVFNVSNTADWRQLYATLGLVTAILAGLVWLAYGVWGNWRTVALAVPLVPLLFGLAWGLGQLNGINYDRGAWRQAAVLHETPAPGWIDLQREVLDLASLNGTGRGEARIDLVFPPSENSTLQPALDWALREFPNVHTSSGMSPAPAPLVITLPGEQPRLEAQYSGTEITVLQRWDPSLLPDFYSRLRWVLYREARQPGAGQSVVLWVKRPELPAQSGNDGAQSSDLQPGSGMIE
jgi:hypothetical protein